MKPHLFNLDNVHLVYVNYFRVYFITIGFESLSS